MSSSAPAASAAALLCDTGALLDYLVESAPDHRLFRLAIDRARTRYVPGLVLAEVDCFLRDQRPVRLRDGRPFELVVHPTTPDRS